MTHIARATIDQAARDIGRLRRTTPKDTGAWWALDRIAHNLECLDLQLGPTASVLYPEYLAISGDEEASVEEALRVVDARVRELRELLAGPQTEQLRAVA